VLTARKEGWKPTFHSTERRHSFDLYKGKAAIDIHRWALKDSGNYGEWAQEMGKTVYLSCTRHPQK
jgi:hypothetical protein